MASWNPLHSKVESGLAALKLEPSAPPAPPDYYCVDSIGKTRWDRLPFFYQWNEIVKNRLNEKKTIRSRDTKLMTEPRIDTTFDEEFKENSQIAKEQAIQKAMETYEERRLPRQTLTDISAFYNQLKIITKQYLLKQLHGGKGFDWLDETLIKTSTGWVLLTESFMNIQESLDKVRWNVDIAYFKSTDWLGRLYINEIKTPNCVMDCRDIATANKALLDLHSTYVLMDDAAYSGQQKSSLLSQMIGAFMLRTTPTTLMIMIPFITRMAMDRFRLALMEYQRRNSDLYTLSETIEPNERIFNFYRHNLKSPLPLKTLTVRIWTGGEIIEESEYLLEHRVLEGVPKEEKEERIKAFHDVMLGNTYQKCYGATLTLFEHKVPDFLSLNANLGYAFEKAMNRINKHYTFNPPYKVQLNQINQIKSSTAQKGGVRRVARGVKHRQGKD
jgi:hypothetical protein